MGDDDVTDHQLFAADDPFAASEFYRAIREGNAEKMGHYRTRVASFQMNPECWDRQMAYHSPQDISNYMHGTGRYAEMTRAAFDRYNREKARGYTSGSSGYYSGNRNDRYANYRGQYQPYNWNDLNWMREVYNYAPADQKMKMQQVAERYGSSF